MHLPQDLQEALERGTNARELLNQPAFTATVDSLTAYHLAAMVAARPGSSDREALEYHHLMQHALTEIVSTLVGYRNAADEIEARLAAGEDDE